MAAWQATVLHTAAAWAFITNGLGKRLLLYLLKKTIQDLRRLFWQQGDRACLCSHLRESSPKTWKPRGNLIKWLSQLLWMWAGSIFKPNSVHKRKRHWVRASLSKSRPCFASPLPFDKVCPSPATRQTPEPSSGAMESTCVLPGSANRGSRRRQEGGPWVVSMFISPAPSSLSHLQKPQLWWKSSLATLHSGFKNDSFPCTFRSALISNITHFSVVPFM